MPTVVHSDTEIIDAELLERELGDRAAIEARHTRTEAAVADALADAAVLVLDDKSPVTADVLADAEDVALIARAGTGVDTVDLEAAAEHGIPVTNVPAYGTEAVATHAIGLLTSVWQAIPRRDRAIRDGDWDWEVGRPVPRLPEATLGIVGFGRIGRRTAAYASGLDLDVLAYDPYVDADEIESHGGEKVDDLHHLAADADVLSLHAPLTAETEGMIDADVFATLPEHAVLVNTARGDIVDQDALREALDAGELRAAALDVLEEEPPGEEPLLDRDDVVTTAHAAWYSEASRRDLNETVARQVLAALDGEDPEHLVDPDAAWL
ncbi:lactate dehydrogenase-like oxidoreductase [Salinarchaeum sp. Harcht-Bsk1]|uniref:C-terminal binding protein n=1 Tax=Salinarchaeum sp. Harcht-Bsk1 TaxID=1333523 RepID=UPI0003423100|nr:C-terminal binding protein [Salinarchaeum sp. Harcht-Bsk1]AGN01560.1 lactate dehydrogenase-like oxidoreductase [Salinarchaeum sp. Harcht-Bsk1]